MTLRWLVVARTLARLVCGAAWLVGIGASHGFADVKVDRLFPPVAQRGTSTVITAEGKFDTWPANVWCDRADVTVTAEEASGQWKVTVAADSPPGVAWLRFYDDGGASSLIPLVIESVPAIAEVEPNNDLAKATRVDLPAIAYGKLEKSGDVDCFVVSATAGQTLVASVMANRLIQSPMDGVLQLVDTRGNVLAQNDDARAIDPRIVYTFAQDGDYVLRLFAFPLVPNSTIGFAGGADFVYRMAVTVGPVVEYALPLVEPRDGLAEDFQPSLFGWNLPADAIHIQSAASDHSPTIVSCDDAIGWSQRTAVANLANPIVVDLTRQQELLSADQAIPLERLPALVSGQISKPGEVIRLRAEVTPGKKHRATVYSQSHHLQLDSVLTVVEAGSGKQLGRNDDAAANNRDATLDFTVDPKSDQTMVEVQIADLVGGFGINQAFTLAVYAVEPSVALTVDATQFKLASGGSVELPVKVARLDGFDQALSIRAIDLPDGVTCEAVTSEPKGDTAKEVKLKLQAAADASPAVRHATIRIVAQQPSGDAAAESDPSTIATASGTIRPGFVTHQFWLTLTGT